MTSPDAPVDPPRSVPRSVLLLGSGELGKELSIAAQRLGVRVIAADRYRDAPAMQVAHAAEVLSLMDRTALEGVIRTHRPDLIVPELEAVSSEALLGMEADGFRVVPSADAVHLAMHRDAMRDLVGRELGIRTPRYLFVSSLTELREACDTLGYPAVAKPVVSSSGVGQSVIPGPSRVERAWAFAHEGGAGGPDSRVLVEEFIEFESEITLLTTREWDGTTTFSEPIGQRQERGDYRESWVPAGLDEPRVREMQEIATTVTNRLGGAGLYGVEFFVTKDEVIFSEVSLGPHDTGLVTILSQDLSQFDLHLRALLGLPVPAPRVTGPSASAVILADREGEVSGYRGLGRALQVETSRLLIFGKPRARPYRRMGVALASGGTAEEARARALEAASRVSVEYV
jgi:phosphoribosylglycinamide formyltransferase 2